MKLTKKIEAEIRKVYQAYWDSYLSGDLKTMGGFLSDDFTLIGTSDGEIFNNKKSAMKYLKATINQVAGVLSKKNIEIKITQVDDTILANEFSDAYIKLDGTPSFYDKFRVTTVMKQVRSKWKIIHQHGSLPDSKAAVGETLATEKVKKENRELREAVKRRTHELELKNRDLEIEAALEKVRGRTMAMHRSDELREVVNVLYGQLRQLGFRYGGANIALMDPDSGDMHWWMSGFGLDEFPDSYLVKYFNHPTLDEMLQRWKSGEKFASISFAGKSKKKFDQSFLFKSDFSRIPEEIKLQLANLESATFSLAYMKYGALNIGVEPITSEQAEILQRFAIVFEQTYTRFLDLKKAEAQTQESQIQLALERVRARTMAMQQSDELQEAANVLFRQVQSLGIPVWSCGYNIWEKHERVCTGWMSTIDTIQPPFKIPLTESPTFIRFYNSRQKDEDFFVEKVEGDALVAHYKYMFSLPDFAKIGEALLKAGFPLPKSQINHVANFAHGNLIFLTSEPVPDAWDIFKRFAKVFEQTYTRFLDLKKAEAQAREAQIEAALEKVRSSSMGMHHSDELEKVVGVLFDKLSELGLSFDGALIYNFNKGTRDIQLWVASKILSAPVKVKLPHDDEIAKNPIVQDLWKAIERGEHVLNKSYSGKVKDDYFLYVENNNENDIAQAVRDLQLRSESYTISFAAEKNSVVGFDSWTGQMTSDQDFQVIRRFAGVFEQAYTRFLDLQRAEAQAREAQIQLALERVRARTMAMYVSSDLAQISAILFDQLKQLGVSMWVSGFSICREDSVVVEKWMTRPDGKIMDTLYIPYTEDPSEALCYEVWKNGVELHAVVVGAEEIRKGHEHYRNTPSMKIIVERMEELGLELPHWCKVHTAAFKHGYLSIVTTAPFEETQIFVRFAKVFEQTYTRFLDLKNAEALARESQIQLALERVRARTMAMQKSDELKEVAMLLFKQVADLGITCWTTGFNVWSEDGNSYVDFVTNPVGGFMEPYTVDTTTFAVIRDVSAARKKGETFYVRLETGDRQKETYAHLSEFGDKDQYGKILESGFQFPSQQVNHFVFGSKVSLMFITYEPVPQSHDIFKRFGKVFEQTYTRFLDLQNAEAQARESQIQLALERVRARTMAMQRSDELSETAVLMFQQIKSFGLELWGCGFNIWQKDEKECMGWMSSPDGGIVPPVKIPLTEHPVFIKFYESRQKGIEFYTYERGGKELGEFYEYLGTVQEALKEYLDSGGTAPTFQIDHIVNFAHGNLIFITYEPCPDAHDIFKRFGKVFEQTYTRFLDLQNAEAQARESQIQLALERVRARTMAMQRSDELNDLAILLFQQVSQLGIKVWATGFNDWSEDNNSYIDYITSPQGSLIEAFSIDVTEYPVFVEIANARKSRVEFWVQYLEGEMLKGTHAHLRKSGNKRYEKMVEEGYQFPSHQYNHFVFGSKVSVMFNTYEPAPEAHDIFIRFGKVFEQTYTRFLDLQKAEAQAREAQIEAALERVRSRTMAMHKSDELLDVITVVSEQLQHVGIKFATVSFGKNSISFDMDFWVAGPELKLPIKIYAPYSNSSMYNRLREAHRQGRNFFSDSFTAEETKIWNQHVIDHNPEIFSEKTRGYLTSRQGMIRSAVLLKSVFLLLINYDLVAYTNEEIEIVIRFANVFEQTYTRFLDLQKAEMQAREAQIQLALERIRARTMAMHQSIEVRDVAVTISDQLHQLGFGNGWCSVVLIDGKSGDMEWWMGGSEERRFQESYFIRNFNHPAHRGMVDGFVKNEKFRSFRLSGEAKRTYDDGLFIGNGFENVPDQAKDWMRSLEAAEFSVAYNKHGALHSGVDKLSDEQADILQRFANVFEQTYTRFLDLQKAEAQAREAQIESALEKIRSRSLAMHHSGELKDVVAIMFEKMKELNAVIGTIAIQLFDQNTMNSIFWVGNDLHDEPPKVKLPYDEKMFEEDGYVKDSWEFKKKGENIINKEYTLEQKTRFFEYVFASNDLATISEADRDLIGQSIIKPPNGHIVCLINEKNSSVFADSWNGEFYNEESIKVLSRAAKVFEQAYVRFLDLQKAEAQARESQIEAALERVRSRTMAMHKSEELLDVIVVVSQQLTHLSFRFDVVSFARTSEMHDYRYWFCLENAKQAYEMHVPYLNNPMFERVKSAISLGAKFLADTLTVEENREWVEHMLAHGAWPDITNEVKDFLLSRGYARSIVFMPQIMLFLGNYFLKPYSEEQNNILKRFAAVFEQSYTRFLDLQKAEAQAREAQIEAALERVRAKAMAMHTAQQLTDVVHELRKQMGLLGQRDLETCVIHLNDESPDFVEAWAASRLPNRSDEIQEFHVMIPKRGLKIIEESMEAYSANRKDYVIINDGARLDEWIEFMRESVPGAHALVIESVNSSSQEIKRRAYWSFADFQGGSMLMVTLAEPDETSRALLRRFANVFGLAYRRFADLKQAEEQAREAQIETALEKIRSRSLAMHHSGELKDVVAIVFEKMTELNVVLGTIAIQLFDQSSMSSIFWPANNLDEPRNVELPYDERMMNEDTYHKDSWQAKIRGENIINKEYSLEQKTKFFDYVYAHNDLSVIQEVTREFIAQNKGNIVCLITQKNSALFADSWNGQFYSEESIKVLTRASKVFEQAYVRFLDLQKAEAQARESTIEAALEKIRSRSLGMHKSEEILDVVAILFEKLKELGLVFDGGAAIHLFSEGSRDATIWVMSPELSRPIVSNLPYDEVVANNPIILDVWKARDTGQHIVNKHYSFDEKKEYFDYVFKHNALVLSDEVKDFIRSANSYTANFIAEKNSLLGASSWTGQVFSENDIEVLKRVARVFEQAYIRFLDLQRAEAQAREATIEAALEKIRSRSLGMHQSDELKDVVSILFEKLKELDLPFDGGAGLFLFPEGSRDTYLWVTNGHVPPVCNYLPYDEHDFSENPVMQDVWKAKNTGEPLVSKHYSSEEKNKLFSYTSEHNDETKIPEEERKRVFEANSYTATFIPEKNSLLSVDSWTKQIMSAGDVEILKRFARVFEQAYVRFLDLQKAEVHAREAICQASLDRVRAEIASMRTIEDLDRITPLIWRELNTIGIPFIRCGVFIMDEINRVVHTFLSTPEGKAIAVFKLPFDTPGRLGRIVPNWQDKKVFLDYWDDVAMKDVADILVGAGIFSSSQQYLDTLPKEGFHLHFLPFAQGMLYVANLTQLKDEELTLLQSLADAFATAYARYDDFNKLESAKQQVDRTLVDLKQAQQQLVQSEKMASLGELTAGIAHEIQNPLNFVNNFSEVSNELIDEMKTELHAGNLKEAAELAESIKRNLEKINHHGKRADGIVKGMLQHSRAGSGQKEPTDLNFLCDEYLRLAYHGYRAKEKSFNAKFESSFDQTLPKVNVVGQDIGRVILNLINNAFYAVTEMKRQKVDGYEPIVSVITKNLSGKVEIRVKDNGIGISEKVLEKIFQPFFTTKPTGQGTGLGLSLSYDIIKAHGGTLEVSSKPGEGSEFIIQLPT